MDSSKLENSFAFPIPFVANSKASAVELSGKSAYSYLLTRNAFAYLIAAFSIALQIYLYISLDLFEEAFDYFSDEPDEPVTSYRGFDVGPIIFNKTSFQPQCIGNMSNPMVVCEEKEEAVFLDAVIVGTMLLVITVAPEIFNGIRLVLLGRIKPIMAGLCHSVMGLVAIVFGFAWAKGEAKDGFSFIRNLVVLLFINVVDGKMYSYFYSLAPAWHENVFSTLADDDFVDEGKDSSTGARKDEIALHDDLVGED